MIFRWQPVFISHYTMIEQENTAKLFFGRGYFRIFVLDFHRRIFIKVTTS